MGVFGDIAKFLATRFTAAAGWAWDTVVGGLTDWIARGVMALMMALWNFMDTASTPSPDAEWFSGAGSTPFNIGFQIGVMMAALLVLLGIIRGVVSGSPGAVAKTVCRDLPIAAFAAASTIGISKVAIEVSDGISDYVWAQTRDDAEHALGGLIEVMMTLNGGNLGFASIVLGVGLILVMMFMWVVLFVRESLIYVVIIYAVAFGFPSMLFAPMRETSKKVLELLVALIIAKPVMVLAMSVGLSALGGVGATGQPGDAVGDNIAAELGTMIVGLVVFGMAAFMPYLTWKLMPVVAAAAIAQGIASSPIRGATQTAQLQYYGSNAMRRMSGSGGANRGSGGGVSAPGGAGAAGGSAGGSAGGPAGGGAAGGMAGGGGAAGGMAGSAAGGAAAGGASGAGSMAAAPVAGPGAPVVVAAAAAKTTASTVRSTASSTVDTATTPSTPSPPDGACRDVTGGS